MKRIVWSRRAQKDMRRLDPQEARRVGRALDRYVETGHGDVSSLKAVEGEKRLRVGDLRLFFVESSDLIEVLAVLPRDKAYRIRENLREYGMEAVEA